MDVRTIRQLAEVMDQYQLGELTLEQNDSKVHLVKRAFSKVAPIPEDFQASEVEQVAVAPANVNAPAATEGYQITSPLVGTFYRRPNEAPDAQEFVTEGSHVMPGTIVCIIEAMKVMNEIKAEKAGTITKVLVENGTPVEFGQPLFELKED